MTNGFDEMILNMTDTTPEPEYYTGEDGLLYCGKCHKPKRAISPKKPPHGWGVTATRQNVTASGQSVRNGKPQRNSAVTLKLSSG